MSCPDLSRRDRRGIWLVLLLGAVSATAAAAPPDLVAELQRRPPDRLIELTLTGGRISRGYLVQVTADSLVLRADQEAGSGPVHGLTPVALASVVLAREWRSNAGRGFGWGAASGALVVGSLGVLMGAYLGSINDSSDSDVGPLVVMTLLGAGTGALGGGLLGGGVGALSSSWLEIWPRVGNVPAAWQPRPSEATRLGLFAGAGRSLLDDYEVTRFAGHASLGKNLGQYLDLGPEIAYFHFKGATTERSGNGTYLSGRDSILKIGLSARLHDRSPGLSPYGTVGVGWFLSDDAYFGAHAGGGLRWQYVGGHDLEFDVRHHFSLSRVSSSQVSRFWTLGLGLGFSL